MSTTAPAPAPAPAEPRVYAIESFTDEEVALLSVGAPMVVTPYLDLLDDAGREVALQTAFRGLVARGVVDPPTTDAVAAASLLTPTEGRVSVDLGVRGDVLSAMTLRDAAESVLALARTAGDGHDCWYAHVVGEVTLVEEVGPSGLHRFTLAHTADLGTLLSQVAVHAEATDGVGEVEVLATGSSSKASSEAPPPELLGRLGAAYLRVDLVRLSRTDPDAGRPSLTGLFTGPEGSWSLVADPATGTLTARPETVAGLADRLSTLVSGLLA